MARPLQQDKGGTIHELQSSMDTFVRTRGWYEPGCAKPQTPRNLAASIALEAGEILEHFQWSEDADQGEVGAELADVVLYVAQLANVLDIDLGSAITDKQALNERRYPAIDEQWQRLAS